MVMGVVVAEEWGMTEIGGAKVSLARCRRHRDLEPCICLQTVVASFTNGGLPRLSGASAFSFFGS